MNNTIKLIVAGVAVLVVGFILGTLGGSKNVQTDNINNTSIGATSYDRLDVVGEFTQGIDRSFSLKDGDIRIGTTTGAYISKILIGTCNLTAVGTDAIAGGAAKTASCTAPGAVSGDKIALRLPYVSGSMVVMTGAVASTTASGIITVGLYNASSTVASAVSVIGTTTSYLITR